MSSKQETLIVNGWENGIADSPNKGVGLIKNADIDSFPGAVKVARKPEQKFFKINTVTFTADAGTDICTASGDIESNGATFDGAAVYFTTTDTLPSGLSINTIYFLIYVSDTTFKVATSFKNSAGSASGTEIDITDTGTGVHTMNAVAIGTINWMVENARNDYVFYLSSNGRAWFDQGGGNIYLLHNSAIDTGATSPTNASGNGLAISSFSSTAQMYLFTFRNALIDVIDVYGDTAIEALSWSNAWQTMKTAVGKGNSHEAIRSQDDAIYYCDDRHIGSIIEKVDQLFDPGNASTYTYNNQALDLPTYEIAQCLEEQNINLLIGGDNYNKIYPWDRRSKSFNHPMNVPEYGIKKMKNIGGIVYILAGTAGNIYTTQGTYVNHYKKIPTYVVNRSYVLNLSPVTWGGIAESNRSLLFGLSGLTTGSSGVYRLYPNGRLVHDNIPSTGSANVQSILGKEDAYRIGYNGGVDKLTTSQYSTGRPTILHSFLYKVGNRTGKAAYSELEVILGRGMSSGSIRVSYRRDLGDSFTTLETFTTNDVISFTKDIGLTDLENIQFQVEMHGDPEFIELRLHP